MPEDAAAAVAEPLDPLSLAAEFPAATRQQWQGLVRDVLTKSGRITAGADGSVDDEADTVLSWTSYDGVQIKPLYTALDAPLPAPDPGLRPFLRGATVGDGRWDVRQRHADPDPGRSNAAVHADLANGVTSLWLAMGAGGIGVGDLAAVLAGVPLEQVGIALDAGVETPAAAAALLALADDRGLPSVQLTGTLGADPIGTRARTGAPADLSGLGGLAALVGSGGSGSSGSSDGSAVSAGWAGSVGRAAEVSNLSIATVDGTVYHDAGGSDADELAVATAVGVAYLRALTDAGLGVDQALDALEFRFAVSADQFGSIAKLRAARRIWDRVAELSGASRQRRGQRQHAVTSHAMLTRRDPWVNLLRATVACFAAAVGGAEMITVAPFDAALGLPDDLSRRIARNTQAILHDESSLGRVLDAAGGSWYVESRTDALAERAWASFTAIEQAGGALAALDDGLIDRLLATSRDARRADIAHRRYPITGVSEYALLDEPARATSGGQSPQDVAQSAEDAADGPARLPSTRYAEQFEALRDRADAHLARTGRRPRIVLAALGPPAAASARIGFATNLFQAGGLEVVVGGGSPDELAQSYRDSGAVLACLCSSARGYTEYAVPAAQALAAAGAQRIWLAGPIPPDERRAELAGAGVDGYVFTGCDAVRTLESALTTAGVR